MSVSSMILDPTHMALRAMQRTEHEGRVASARFSVVKAAAAAIPVFARKWLSPPLIRWLDKQAEQRMAEALFYKGAAVDLQSELASGMGDADPRDLVKAIDSYVPEMNEVVAQCRSAAKVFRDFNSRSKVADAFEKVAGAFQNVSESMVLLRVVATGGSVPGLVFAYDGVPNWEAAVAHQREEFNLVRDRIRSRDASDIDPELLHLAEMALSSPRDLGEPGDWARRLTDRTVH